MKSRGHLQWQYPGFLEHSPVPGPCAQRAERPCEHLPGLGLRRVSPGPAVALEEGRAAHVRGEPRPQAGVRDRRDAETDRGDALAEGTGHPRGDQARDRERERDEPVVEREDPPTDLVGYDPLEPVGRERPLGTPAEVRDRDGRLTARNPAGYSLTDPVAK